jgi:hypothetical protein
MEAVVGMGEPRGERLREDRLGGTTARDFLASSKPGAPEMTGQPDRRGKSDTRLHHLGRLRPTGCRAR